MAEKKVPKAIVLRTAGTNCDDETRYALQMAGFEADLIHINSLIKGSISLEGYQLLVLPGGFANGDYIASAKILANKIRFHLYDDIMQFISEGKLILGICNGFQALVKAGLLPAFNNNYNEINTTLTFNDSAHLQCEWVELKATSKRCIFTKGIKELFIPIAHGEGKFFAPEDVLKRLSKNDQIAFKYKKNPTGTLKDIAGICDESGRILGMMPHPERNILPWQDPRALRQTITKGCGMKVFENAFSYCQKNFD